MNAEKKLNNKNNKRNKFYMKKISYLMKLKYKKKK